MIQLLVDENVSVSVMDWLKNRGLDVRRVSEVGLKGVENEEVARYAIKNDMVIPTLDTDFAYIYHELFRGSLGIIVIRVKPRQPST